MTNNTARVVLSENLKITAYCHDLCGILVTTMPISKALEYRAKVKRRITATKVLRVIKLLVSEKVIEFYWKSSIVLH
jgi:hypothetical protein